VTDPGAGPTAGTPAEFLRTVTESGVTVYSSEDIGERNATYEVALYAPGFLLVGDDGGGLGFLVRADDPDSAVFSSGLGDLEPADFEIVSASFPEWLASLGTAH